LITVDDPGARHRARNGMTTQIGLLVGCGDPTTPQSDRFTVFATSCSKSRRNVLEILRAGHDDYVLNAAAFAYMAEPSLAGPVIDQLAMSPSQHFADRPAWQAHLEALGLTQLAVTPDPVKIATEGALWGSIRYHGLLDHTVIVSDDAGQFRIGQHALCWVHAERLVHQLIPFNDRQRLADELVRQLIWWFPMGLWADLKAYQRDPCRKRAPQLRARFDRIFRRRTGFVTLDRLMARLHARKSLPSGPRSGTGGPSCSGSSTGPRSRSTPTARRTTSVATSPSARSPAAPGARPAAMHATPVSAS
jgi:hypothetical protein